MGFQSFKETQEKRKKRSRLILELAAFYNIVWGASVVLIPNWFFEAFGMKLPAYPEIWQCVGMIVGVYGVGYYLASKDPARHWPIVVVGLLGKILGPIGFVRLLMLGQWPLVSGLVILANDLIWWVPFGYVLYYSAVELHRSKVKNADGVDRRELIDDLMRRSHERPQFILFIRHFGCVFCKEMLADLAKIREEIAGLSHDIALVHMSRPERAGAVLDHYGLTGVHTYSDPDCELYAHFRISRGGWLQMFGPSSVRRGLAAMLRGGHGVGALEGEGFQLPGMVILENGKVKREHTFRFAGERPDYIDFVQGGAPAGSNRWCCRGALISSLFFLR